MKVRWRFLRCISADKLVVLCQGSLATIALLNIFSTLSFSPNPLALNAQIVFAALLSILSVTPCNRSRLLILQYTMRLRSDRDHRVYLVSNIDEEVEPLAKILGFTSMDEAEFRSSPFKLSQDIPGTRAASISVGAGSRSRPSSRGGRPLTKTT